MKVFSSTLAVIVGAAAVCLGDGTLEKRHGPDWDLSKPMNGITFERIKAISAPVHDKPTAQFSRLRSVQGRSSRGSITSALGRALRGSPNRTKPSFQNISSVGEFSTQYAVQCGWDGTPVWLLFDTGSADSWAAQSGFECLDSLGEVQEAGTCGFGGAKLDDFGGGAIDDLHFYLKYGSGEKVSGPMGYSNLACGGVSVDKQQVGLANSTYWHGNNMTVGILGLAYPSITSAYYGDIGSEATWNAVTYTPFLTNAITQGSIEPVFSVALSKNSSDGVLAWGGLPPIDWQRGDYGATDLIIVRFVTRYRG